MQKTISRRQRQPLLSWGAVRPVISFSNMIENSCAVRKPRHDINPTAEKERHTQRQVNRPRELEPSVESAPYPAAPSECE